MTAQVLRLHLHTSSSLPYVFWNIYSLTFCSMLSSVFLLFLWRGAWSDSLAASSAALLLLITQSSPVLTPALHSSTSPDYLQSTVLVVLRPIWVYLVFIYWLRFNNFSPSIQFTASAPHSPSDSISSSTHYFTTGKLSKIYSPLFLTATDLSPPLSSACA